jgi:hypothetical protein
MQAYLVDLDALVHPANWFSVVRRDAACSRISFTCDDDLVSLCVWLRDTFDTCVHDLVKETMAYENARNQMTDDARVVGRLLTTTTNSCGATTQYNMLAGLCREVIRCSHTGVSNDNWTAFYRVFYGFGQYADSSFGGGIPRFVEFKANLEELVSSYCPPA